jgi:hypothetical protein
MAISTMMISSAKEIKIASDDIPAKGRDVSRRFSMASPPESIITPKAIYPQDMNGKAFVMKKSEPLKY